MKSLIVYSIPAFFILIAIELIIDKIKKTHLVSVQWYGQQHQYRHRTTVTGVLLKILNIGVYIWIYENYRITTIPLTWYTWILLLFGVDFFYYWLHRLSHEVSVLGVRTAVHQSEEYNFVGSAATVCDTSIWLILVLSQVPLAFFGFGPYCIYYGSVNSNALSILDSYQIN